ncbi:hypothetical protein ASD8599_03968 [Ascidiaceihabitans donghaensis]|uniref:Type VI secretion system baseplate subunit TssG n=2 Tax=Ascidiaceihabitans TaxID=1648492 RepID=A0A2R8BPJ2_9RHOB|nr:type VI secretion system baseplate subunit TssG [Ascidiaceihabitans donghaensis]SPH27502.1 hypothetical protein ASD8599_03968 [Ascidiaceihabitans donghaensis]
MTAIEDKGAEDAFRRGLFATLRELERQHPDKPRIGRSVRLKDEYIAIGQDPTLAFPSSDIRRYERRPDGKMDIRSQVLGFFGPQGALPLDVTKEAAEWKAAGDESFVRFTDMLGTRFFQLFFRAWSDAHAISQFDHPESDRFASYIGALSGVSTPAFLEKDSIEDVHKASLVPLHANRVKSPVRLRQLIELHLGAQVEVVEHAPSWLDFEEADQNRMGQRGSMLGQNMFLGARMQTVNDRIELKIQTRSLKDYRRYLPGGLAHKNLEDLVFWYLGKTIEVGVELSLPAEEIPPAQLGQTVELGWMAAVLPANDNTKKTGFVTVAKYTLGQAA